MQGLAKAMLQHKETPQEEVGELQWQIKALKQNVWENAKGLVDPPEGFEYNDRIIDFDILVRSGMYQPVKWVKWLDSGQVTLYTDTTGPHTNPHIANLYI
jgi:hypothetical protein